MATAGELGAAGGAGGAADAATRVEVLDPHLLIMMRDVMGSGSANFDRLAPGPGAGGGGGGGGTGTGTSTGGQGQVGQSAGTTTNSIIRVSGAAGGAGGSGKFVFVRV